MDSRTLTITLPDGLVNRGHPGSGAVFDGLGDYRYLLWREWDSGLLACHWIMLNPSTADEDRDDATIRRCIAFAKQAGYGSIIVTNLFALRSTLPVGLRRRCVEPIGNANDQILQQVATNDFVGLTVAAWGTHGGYMDRDRDVMTLLSGWLVDCWCLGTTQAGYPKHPVRLAGATEFIEYKGRPAVRRRA